MSTAVLRPRSVCLALFAIFALTPSSLFAGEISSHIDRDWLLNSLQYDILGQMPDVAVMDNGFVRTDVGDGWSVSGDPTGNGLQMSQGRTGYTLGMASRQLQGVVSSSRLQEINNACTRVSDYILNNGITSHGGYYWGFNYDGSIPESGSYDQYDSNYALGIAAVGMAMANAYQVSGQSQYYQGVTDAWNVIDQNMRDSWGNPISAMEPDFSDILQGSNQETRPNMNHLMHTLEMLRATYEVAPAGDKAAWGQELSQWTGYLMDECYRDRPGYANHGYWSDIYEVNPSTGAMEVPADGYVNAGHSLETAYFVSRTVEMLQADGVIDNATAQSWLDKAGKVVDYCVNTAYAPYTYQEDGQNKTAFVLFEKADFDGNLDPGQNPGSWQQCELMRALAHFATLRGQAGDLTEAEMWAIFDQILLVATGQAPGLGIEGETAHFMDMEDGGWVRWTDDGTSTSGRLGSWGGSYHEGMLYDELLRLETVPEPASLSLMGLGAIALLRKRRRA